MVETLFSTTKQLFLRWQFTFSFQIVNLPSSSESGESNMTRGNQRDLAREKAAKKDKGSTKAANEQKGNEGLSKEQRMQRDADRMREKQKAKEAVTQAGASGGKKWCKFPTSNFPEEPHA